MSFHGCTQKHLHLEPASKAPNTTVSQYLQISSTRRNKFQQLNVSCLALLLYLPSPLKPEVKSRVNMYMEHRLSAMFDGNLNASHLRSIHYHYFIIDYFSSVMTETQRSFHGCIHNNGWLIVSWHIARKCLIRQSCTIVNLHTTKDHYMHMLIIVKMINTQNIHHKINVEFIVCV